MPSVPLSLFEQEEIAVASIENREVSWAAIGRRGCRYRTTVAREVARSRSDRDLHLDVGIPAAASVALTTTR